MSYGKWVVNGFLKSSIRIIHIARWRILRAARLSTLYSNWIEPDLCQSIPWGEGEYAFYFENKKCVLSYGKWIVNGFLISSIKLTYSFR